MASRTKFVQYLLLSVHDSILHTMKAFFKEHIQNGWFHDSNGLALVIMLPIITKDDLRENEKGELQCIEIMKDSVDLPNTNDIM